MVKAISGVTTVRFKNELVRNITIKLGYANAKVRYLSTSSEVTTDINRSTNAKTKLVPGQDATVHIDQTRKTTLLAKDLAVVDA